MHVPDGFIGGAVSAGAGAAAAAGLALAVRKAADELDDGAAPLAGLVSAFVFAAQMITFPIAAGTSGHLIGGALAAVLLGPWAGAICLAVVVGVQALFADGGLTALGLNLVNLSLVTTFGGYAVFAVVGALLPRTRGGLAAAAGIAAGASVVLASTAFVVEYALGGNGGADVRAVFAAMTGVHSVIAVGEGLVTAGAVAMVLAARPDLVHGARRSPAVLAEGVA